MFKKKEVIRDIYSLNKLANKMRYLKEFAYDTEFTTLKCHGPNSQFKLVDVSISWGDYNNYLIPLGHVFDTKQISMKMFVKIMKPIFEREDVVIIGHNIKIDMHSLARVGINVRTPYIFDTMIASWICDENEPKGLKENAIRILNREPTKFNEVVATVTKEEKKQFGFKGQQKPTVDLVKIENVEDYAIDDAYNAWWLYIYYIDKLVEEEMDKIYYKTYPAFIYTLYKMEERGITVDKKKLKEMGEQMQKDIDRMMYDLLDLAGININPASNKQLNELLFNYVVAPTNPQTDKNWGYFPQKDQDRKWKDYVKKMKEYEKRVEEIDKVSFKFPVISTTPKGAPQCNNASLEKLAKKEYTVKRKKEGVEFCKILLEYNRLQKLKTAFVDGLFDHIYDDDRCHPSFNSVGTDSGRISCIAGGTPVTLVNGQKPIEKIRKNDLVYCYDKESNPKISRVKRLIDNGIKSCIKIIWRSTGKRDYGELICTPDHKIRLRNGSWVRADHLVTGDKLTSLSKHEVVSIEYIGSRHVYDLEIEEHHNFIASEICVHNCSAPNLMQLPNDDDSDDFGIRKRYGIGDYSIRECFIGGIDKRTGKRKHIISVDFSNLEVRVIAHFSKDPVLIKAFNEGKDLHGNTAKMMFRLDCDANDVKKMFPDLRKQGKVIAFLLQYGGGSFTLYNDLNKNGELDEIAKKVQACKGTLPKDLKDFKGCKDGKAIAQRLMDMYFDAFEGIAKFMTKQKKYAHRNGHVYTLVKRKRRLPDINSSDFKKVGYNERLSINACIQGSGADIMINAQNKIDGTIEKAPITQSLVEEYIKNGYDEDVQHMIGSERLRELNCDMLVQIHDELLFECPPENCDEAMQIIRDYMIHPFGEKVKLNLPLEVGMGAGESYANGH